MSRVLVLSYLPIYPANGGGRVRIRELAANLARRHEVTLVCPPAEGTPDEAPSFTVHAAGVPGMRQLVDPRGYRTIVDIVRKVRPDYILAEYIWQSLHANLARLTHEAPVILDAFDVVTERFRRAGNRLWPLISLLERFALRTADRVFAVSEVDRSQLVRLGAHPERTSIVPNGVDTSRFRPDPAAGRHVRERLGIAKDERLLFFLRQLDYAPNAEAVKILLTEILPRLAPDYRLAIAGHGSVPQLDRMDSRGRTMLLGPVDTISDYINAADILVAPLLRGSGTRLKLLEALSCGAPTVATSKAAEGLDLAACEPSLLVADGWDTFATAVRAATTIQRRPPSHAFRERYDWREIVERIRL